MGLRGRSNTLRTVALTTASKEKVTLQLVKSPGVVSLGNLYGLLHRLLYFERVLATLRRERWWIDVQRALGVGCCCCLLYTSPSPRDS